MNYRDYFENVYAPEMLEPTRSSMVIALKDELLSTIKNKEGISKNEIDAIEISPTVENEDYLSFKACADNVTVRLKKQNSASTFTSRPIYYRKLDTNCAVVVDWGPIEWNVFDYTQISDGSGGTVQSTYKVEVSAGTIVNLNSGETVQYRSNTVTNFGQFNAGTGWVARFFINGLVEASGNVMSLCDKSCLQTVATQYTFYNLFYGCTGLTTPPKLPATVIHQGAYQNMFYGCTNLKYCPDLPGKNITYCSYNSMFRGCTTISATSRIMATNGDNGNINTYTCQNMFHGCTKLKRIYCNFGWVRTGKDTTGWVTSVPTGSTGEFHKRPTMSTTTTGTSWIPKSWKVISDMTDI